MLGCSKLDTVVLDIGMETVESDNYRKMSRNDGNTNGMLAII